MSADLGKIKDRIAKLLAMAKDSSSPNEAAIAASRARHLMDKYQVTEMDLSDTKEEVFDAKSATRFFAAIPTYMSTFAVVIGKYNDCQAVFEWGWVDFKKKPTDEKKWGKRIQFRGYASDVQLAIDMYNSLLDTVDRLCKEFLVGKGYDKYPVGVGNQFKIGAITEISRRIEEMTIERDSITMEHGPEVGKGLVLYKEASVNEYFGEVKYSQTKYVSTTDSVTREARAAGTRKGRTVEINKTLG